MTIPYSYRDIVGWQRIVANEVNPVLGGYPFPQWGAEPDGTNEGYVFYDLADGAPKWFDGTNYNTFGKAILEGLGDPGGDRVVVWDDSETAIAYSTPTAPVAMSGTALGLNGTKAQFNSSCSDGDFLFVGDVSSGWTQISTSSSTGASIDLSTGSTYNDLVLTISGASHNNGASQALQLAISPDGSTFSAFPVSFSTAVNSSSTLYGGVFIPRCRGNQGMMTMAASDNGTNGFGSSAGAVWPWRCAGIAALRISFTAGNIDAGTFTLYGR